MVIEASIKKVGIPLGFPSGIFSRWYYTDEPIFNLSVSTVSHVRIDLSWTDDCADEDGYKIEISTDGLSWSALATANADATSYSSIGLTPATKYYYRIRAFKGSIYTTYSNIDSDSTSAAP